MARVVAIHPPSTSGGFRRGSPSANQHWPTGRHVAADRVLACGLGCSKVIDHRRAGLSKGAMPVNSPPPQQCHVLIAVSRKAVN
ncbi:hypothetical protein I546_7167 [Mycobacterium kansasii 732]|nr:hypothetical protein I546_7167 [Mycobacterium kansasii 732]